MDELLRAVTRVALSADNFQSDYSEAVDIRFLRQIPPHCVFRSHVATACRREGDNWEFRRVSRWSREDMETGSLHSPCYPGADMRVAIFMELGEPKVGDLRIQMLVKQHIAGLDVPVDDLEGGLFVEIPKAPCYAEADLLPRGPVEFRPPPGIFIPENRGTNSQPYPHHQMSCDRFTLPKRERARQLFSMYS